MATAEVRVALVIGNGDYEIVGKLRNPVSDARLISDVLSGVGFDVTALTDLTEDQMGEAIDSFVRLARDADVAAVYYAGHGLQKDGENYLMPIDAKLGSESAIAREGISLNDLTAALADVPISMIFLDACRNNPFAEALMSAAQSDGRSAGIKRGLAVIRTPGDMLVTFATLPNTVASDGADENSPFATALSQHIGTPDVEVSVLMKRVTADVMAATDSEQRPQQLSQMMTEFYFNRSGSETTAPKQSAPVPVAQKPERSLLTVYPPRVSVGEEVSIVADLTATCVPSFFNLSPGRKFTPIPLEFFKQVSLANGQTRFEISPGSRFGLVVQEQDEKGQNMLGYFCPPASLVDPETLKLVLREIVANIRTGDEDGTVNSADYGAVRYQARPYFIE
ncbi:MAG: caspase family protein [Tateyamaria sp.]|uniref:caspase family protein n=1 Tax=Tateyamaria sp. TaxID=1929288 RepID=UPI0032A10B1B